MKTKLYKVVLTLLCLLGMMAAETQSVQAEVTYKKVILPNDSIRKGARLTWSTNLVDWLYFAPNVGLEIDLKDPRTISAPSLFFQITGRPSRTHTLEDYLKKYPDMSRRNIAFAKAHAEYRWHFRMLERKEQRHGMVKPISAVAQLMMKPIYTQSVDTAGNFVSVPNRKAAVQRSVDSTMISTRDRRFEMFPGRYYFGFYAEATKFLVNSKATPFFRKNAVNLGQALGAGISAGYDFPGFNYNHTHFLQWSLGASVGVGYATYDSYTSRASIEDTHVTIPATYKDTKTWYPALGLRVAMNFRNMSISHKYWQPDNTLYEKNKVQNHLDSLYLQALDSLLQEKPIVIEVHSVDGVDSTFHEVVTKAAIAKAFKKQTGFKNLLLDNFYELEATPLPIKGKDLSDNHRIEYRMPVQMVNYEDSVTYNTQNFSFRVEIAGRQEAQEKKDSLLAALNRYYEQNGHRPQVFGMPFSRDSLLEHITLQEIADTISAIWGEPLDTSLIRRVHIREDKYDEEKDEKWVSYDSVIATENLNRPETYAFYIQFHPQVYIDQEDNASHFQIRLTGMEEAKGLRVSLINAHNEGLQFRIQRPWKGKEWFDEPISKQEILDRLDSAKLVGFEDYMLTMSDSIYTWGNDSVVFDFGVTQDPFTERIIIEDSVGRNKARNDFSKVIKPWLDEQYWKATSGMTYDDPVVPGYKWADSTWFVAKEKFIDQVIDITGLTLQPWQVDTVVTRVSAKPNARTGYYRAYAYLKLHRELKDKDGGPQLFPIPYQLNRVDTPEAAGYVDPNKRPTPKLDGAIIDSLYAYSLDSLLTVTELDSVMYDSLMALGMDSIKLDKLQQYLFDMSEMDKPYINPVIEDSLHVHGLDSLLEVEMDEAMYDTLITLGFDTAQIGYIKRYQADMVEWNALKNPVIEEVTDSIGIDSLGYMVDSLGYMIDSLGNRIDSLGNIIEPVDGDSLTTEGTEGEVDSQYVNTPDAGDGAVPEGTEGYESGEYVPEGSNEQVESVVEGAAGAIYKNAVQGQTEGSSANEDYPASPDSGDEPSYNQEYDQPVNSQYGNDGYVQDQYQYQGNDGYVQDQQYQGNDGYVQDQYQYQGNDGYVQDQQYQGNDGYVQDQQYQGNDGYVQDQQYQGNDGYVQDQQYQGNDGYVQDQQYQGNDGYVQDQQYQGNDGYVQDQQYQGNDGYVQDQQYQGNDQYVPDNSQYNNEGGLYMPDNINYGNSTESGY